MSYAIIVQDAVIDGPIVIDEIANATFETEETAELFAFILVAKYPCLTGHTSIHPAKRGYGLIFHGCTFNGHVTVKGEARGPAVDIRGAVFGAKK